MRKTLHLALGRHVDHDPRSRAFPSRGSSELRTAIHRHYGPAFYQGDLGSCTGMSMAQALNTVPLRRGRKLLTEADAVGLYSMATRLDDFEGEYPPTDTGSSGLAACKAAKARNLISGYRWAFGLDDALRALVLTPVLLGINWYQGMYELDSRGFVTPGGRVAGGHEVALIGINVERERVTLLNSWSRAWGLNGRAYLSFDSLDRLLREDGDVAVPTPYTKGTNA